MYSLPKTHGTGFRRSPCSDRQEGAQIPGRKGHEGPQHQDAQSQEGRVINPLEDPELAAPSGLAAGVTVSRRTPAVASFHPAVSPSG